jgi:hypothetical protein
MSTADIIATGGVVIFFIQAVIFGIQTYLLRWYASETQRLREDAAEQNMLIVKQIGNATEQNKLIAEQLKVMAADLEFQRELIEQEDAPNFDVSVSHRDNHSCKIQVLSLKENIFFKECYTNDKGLQYCRKEKHLLEFRATSRPMQVYLTVSFKTNRGKVKESTFMYFTADESKTINPAPAEYQRGSLFPVAPIK